MQMEQTGMKGKRSPTQAGLDGMQNPLPAVPSCVSGGYQLSAGN